MRLNVTSRDYFFKVQVCWISVTASLCLTALRVAVDYGWIDVASVVVSAAPELDVVDVDGSLLINCVLDVDIFEMLMERGDARLDVVNNAGVSPLCRLLKYRVLADDAVSMAKKMITGCPSLVTAYDKSGTTVLALRRALP